MNTTTKFILAGAVVSATILALWHRSRMKHERQLAVSEERARRAAA